MNDFWISSGHHLLDRDEGGGLRVTDEFLKLYLARPELLPPPPVLPPLLGFQTFRYLPLAQPMCPLYLTL